MLAHQLPALPPVAAFLGVLPEFFEWLFEERVRATPASYRLTRGETVIRDQTMRLPLRYSTRSHLEVVRFAAANRLCVDLDYRGSTRRIEPYSLRRTRDDNIILHAWNRSRNGHGSYRVDWIQDARVTDQVFSPRYAVELTPTGPVSIQDTKRSSDSTGFGNSGGRHSTTRLSRRRTSRSQSNFGQGPIYIYECPMCGKKFRRKKPANSLNKHKTPDGFPCSGRTALYVDTQY